MFKEEKLSTNNLNTENAHSNPNLQQSYFQKQEQRDISKKIPQSFLSKSRTIKQPENFGWYTWFSGAEQDHIFWWKNKQGHVFGIELFHARLISDIIIMLPTTSKNTDPNNNVLIKLIDSNNSIIYQWGIYAPKKNEKYASMLPLSKPLGSWKLELYTKAIGFNPSFNLFNIVSTLFIIGAILSCLAFYLYREHRREIILGKQRVNFVSQVSHELKTPLTNIRMYAELLEERLVEDQQYMENNVNPKYVKYIQIISSESQRLSRLIANVLNFSKSTKSGLKIHKTSGKIDTLINEVISKFQPLLTAKNVEFDIQLNAKSPTLFDHDALEQILNNLLSNVEKYGAAGKYVGINSSQQDKFTTITIQDKGPGIPPNKRNEIFKPFYRISSKTTDGVSGTGIGLSIANELAKLHGGDLKLIASECGACFMLRINTPIQK